MLPPTSPSGVRVGLFGVCLLLAQAMCTSSPGDAGNHGGSGGDGGGGAGGGTAILPPDGTGDALVDRLGEAASQCGPQTPFTVPAGWKIVGVGEQGCSGWVPPSWLVDGSGTSLVTAMRDPSGEEGFLGLAGITEAGLDCTPPAVADAVLAGFADSGFATPTVLWHAEKVEEFGGSSWPTGQTVFTTAAGSTQLIGFLWLLASQGVAACDVVGLGFWEPTAAIEAETCALTQILNSVRCGANACSDSGCNDLCQADGKPGGMCNPQGGCDCFEAE